MEPVCTNLLILFYCLFISVTGTFSCTLKFIVKDCDPNTGEADDEGYDDEYVVSEHLCVKIMTVSVGVYMVRWKLAILIV